MRGLFYILLNSASPSSTYFLGVLNGVFPVSGTGVPFYVDGLPRVPLQLTYNSLSQFAM